MRKKLEMFDIRVLDVFAILFITIMSNSASTTILDLSIGLKSLVLILLARLFLALVIFNDHELSWSRSTSSSYFSKVMIGAVAFTFYVPVVFMNLNDTVSIINSLVLEVVFYISLQIILMFLYKHIGKLFEEKIGYEID